MATAPKAPAKKVMVLEMGYNKFIVPNGLHDKVHLLVQMQQIDNCSQYVDGQNHQFWYLSGASTSVTMMDAPDPLYPDRESARKILDGTVEAATRIKAEREAQALEQGQIED